MTLRTGAKRTPSVVTGPASAFTFECSERRNTHTHTRVNNAESRMVERPGTENVRVHKRRRKTRSEIRVTFDERTASQKPASRDRGRNAQRNLGTVTAMCKRAGAGSRDQVS